MRVEEYHTAHEDVTATSCDVLEDAESQRDAGYVEATSDLRYEQEHVVVTSLLDIMLNVVALVKGLVA